MFITFFLFFSLISCLRNVVIFKNKLSLVMKKDTVQLANYLYQPKTLRQKKYVSYLDQEKDYIITAIGPAGTGKTLFACKKAIDSLNKKIIDKIIITRPAVSVEEDFGFLPGKIEKKMEPWTRPIFDIFLESFSKSELNNMISNGIIEISPLGFMRGRTFKNSFIIADEMQNSSPNQMLMLLTRIGDNSRMVITGDLHQSDRITNNGLKDFVYKLKNKLIPDNFYLIEMEQDDVQRSSLVTSALQLYNPDSKILQKEILKSNSTLPVYLTITNPTMSNPTITNTTMTNPTMSNPTMSNPTMTNTTITNAIIANLTISNATNANISNNNGSSSICAPKKFLSPPDNDAAMIPKRYLLSKHLI